MLLSHDSILVAADLPGQQGNASLVEGLTEVSAGAGSVLGEQPPQLLGQAVVIREDRAGPR
ncbi:hypothetical protein SAMN05444166_1113 [Singulisphaera sp. GP187]|uniref:hypothetical protein n=1 Tax=Singulisphaera sp. GP187 TaxID=1882752 RepID=UPI00092CB37A|nr:hypothetical protein [Singulisphaera sp. GP187]SIN82372.1 hypothetical protein SAMN05444166_1113 [Singulisphaera sp. GP187]